MSLDWLPTPLRSRQRPTTLVTTKDGKVKSLWQIRCALTAAVGDGDCISAREILLACRNSILHRWESIWNRLSQGMQHSLWWRVDSYWKVNHENQADKMHSNAKVYSKKFAELDKLQWSWHRRLHLFHKLQELQITRWEKACNHSGSWYHLSPCISLFRHQRSIYA